MDEHEKMVTMAALVGLLHDVGKFAQRAGWQKGEHTEVGAEVVRRYVPTQWREHLYPVMGHHDKPLSGCETKVVALADRLSAGERADEQQEQPKQMLSIFHCVETKDADGKTQSTPQDLYLPLKPLALDRKTLFPDRQWSSPEVEQGYQALWDGFQNGLEALAQAHQNGVELPTYVESLLLLLQRYAWSIPSAYYRSSPDVSLYDHSRMTGALAACLTGIPEEAIDEMLRAPERSAGKVALLVGGDISGIQEFIYTISSRGATSGLRGRSFYLQLLSEAVARFILRRLELPITNVIYQGGGAFYLLARAGDEERLLEIQREISYVLLAHHRGSLYLALADVPLSAADFYGGRISAKWEEVTRVLRGIKQRRFAELGDDVKMLFEPQGHGGNLEQQCQVCGQEHPDTEPDKERSSDDEPPRKCPQCLAYEHLGESLRRADYLWLCEGEMNIPTQPLTVTQQSWDKVLSTLGFQAGITEDWRNIPAGNRRVVLALKDEALAGIKHDAHTATGRRFLVNVTPTISQAEINALHDQVQDLPVAGSVKPFSVMEVQAQGIKRLGVLRMDVDNLGDIFATGLGKAATLSRVAALSFAISLYFEGWVEAIAECMNAGAGNGKTLYSIYSGGDDLFFVGAWDQVVELARRIRADLTPFAAQHPGIHTSAGLVLVSGKYPLAQAAQDAGEAEHAAKSGGKDAIAFLGQVTPWQRFGTGDDSAEAWLGTVSGMKKRLVQLTASKGEGGGGASQALIQRLIGMQQMYEAAAEMRQRRGEDQNRAGKIQTYWGPWIWRGYYMLKRMTDKRSGEPWDSINQLAEALKGDHFSAIEWIGLAARWAELLTQK